MLAISTHKVAQIILMGHELDRAEGELRGFRTSTITIRSADDSFDRIVASIDASGNRTSITLTETG